MNQRRSERFVWLCRALDGYGLTVSDVQVLLRAERSLSRWAERCCGDEHGNIIERDAETGKPFAVHYSQTSNDIRHYPIADLESGALRRARAIASKAGLTVYHQTDPRGCAIYLLRPGDVPEGGSADSYYPNGIACYL